MYIQSMYYTVFAHVVVCPIYCLRYNQKFDYMYV